MTFSAKVTSINAPEFRGTGYRRATSEIDEASLNQLDAALSAIEGRMEKHLDRIERETERRGAEIQRELDLRDVAFRSEQILRDRSMEDRLNGFLSAQAERDKAQLERDKRYEMMSERVIQAAEGAEEAAKQAATVKSNYWAAVIVQLLAVVAILVGGYFANQANVLGAMQTTMAALQAGKEGAPAPPSPPPANQR